MKKLIYNTRGLIVGLVISITVCIVLVTITEYLKTI